MTFAYPKKLRYGLVRIQAPASLISGDADSTCGWDQKALENLVQGRTTIAIAHRLSTLHRADRLVVLDRGRVVEEGTHDALMAAEGAYYNLYQAQARNNNLLEESA